MKDALAIAAILPHRYPFLLVDRVIAIEPGRRIVAVKNVTVNEPFFTGHFPNRPIMPGVLLCEAVVQAGGLLAHESSTLETTSGRPLAMLTALDRVRFRHQVTPGDQVQLEVESVRRRGLFWKMRGIARVNEKIAAELEFTFVFDFTRPEGAPT